MVILKEAGGICSTLDKKEIDLESLGSLVCGNENNVKEFFETADEIL